MANDPSLFLYGIDFQHGFARFFRIDAALPNEHFGELAKRRPLLVPLKVLLAQDRVQATPLPAPIHFIWMTDFCGSTLYAKALNEVTGLYLYNETALFCDIANARRLIDHGLLRMSIEQWRGVLKMALFYQRKTFTAGDVALVKEWPASNYILHEILGASAAFRGIFLYASLEEYLTACLKEPYRRKLARGRVTRTFMEIRSMDSLKGIDLDELSDAQAAALHWLYLMYWHHDRGYAQHPALRTLSNTAFFAEPAKVLQQSARHFGLPLSDDDASQIIRGHVFHQHSKDSSREFSTAAQAAELAAARQRFDDEVTAGLEWAANITRRYPLPENPGTSLLN